MSLSQADKDAIKEIHNRERRAVYVNTLDWSDSLEQEAQKYAHKLATQMHKLVHSTSEDNPNGEGESLAGGSVGYTPAGLADLQWAAEKANFKPPCNAFGDSCSTTGSWYQIGHYTQMVWANTTLVGCGWALDPNPIPDPSWNPEGRPVNYLVCRYSPVGNIPGKPVFGHHRVSISKGESKEVQIESKGDLP